MMTLKSPKCYMPFARRDEGYALLVTMAVSSVLLIFAATIMTIAVHEHKEAERWRRATEAHFLARAGMAEAVYRLKEDYGNMTADGYVGPDTEGVQISTNSENKKFSFEIGVVDPDEVHFMGTPYMTGAFDVTTLGDRGQEALNQRAFEARIERDTFLRYSRFVQQGNLSYAQKAQIIADLYVGGDLNLPGGTLPDSDKVILWSDVEVGDDINNEDNGIFHGDVTGTTVGIDLDESVDMEYYKSLSLGNVPGEGEGLYMGTSTELDLSLFDLVPDPDDPSWSPSYDGNPLPSDFNGVVFCEDWTYVEGVLEGQSLTVVARNDIWAKGDIRTGNTGEESRSASHLTFNKPSGVKETKTINLNGIITENTNVFKFSISGSKWKKARMRLFEDGNEIGSSDLVRTSKWFSDNNQTDVINSNDMNYLELDPSQHTYTAEVSYYSDGTGVSTVQIDALDGDPVNLGLVPGEEFAISSYAPRQTIIDAAILTLEDSSYGWRGAGNWDSHPNGYDSGVWELTFNGPIITKIGGTAGPWSSYGTRYYRYDMDMIEHAPPAFPVPNDWWKVAYWRHLKKGETDLFTGDGD